MIQRIGAVVLIILASSWLGFYAGYLTFVEPCPVNLNRCLERMEFARWSHEQYANNTRLCNATSGNVSHNREWMKDYNEVIKLIEWVKGR